VNTANVNIEDKIALWKTAFENDKNSIATAIHELMWNYAVISTVSKMYEYTDCDSNNPPKMNKMIFDLLISSYWVNTMMSIRRLIDGAYKLDDEKKGIFSIAALVKDIKSSRHLLNRRVLIEKYDCTYDVASLNAIRLAKLTRSDASGYQNIPPDYYGDLSEERHQLIDYLTGTTPENRSESDIVREPVLDELVKRLQKLKPITDFATKYFAHAASAQSRARANLITSLDLQTIWSAIEELSKISELIGRWFAKGTIGNGMPIAQFAKFEYLDIPMMEARDIPKLEQNWESLANETEQWVQLKNDWLEKP
jgi:hypothetical protein